ncbi:MAG: hypothetical protein ACRELY_16685 [Polyangiaceae bacterium]
MPAPATAGVKVHECRHDHVLATWKNFAIVIWRHDTSLAAIENARKMSEELIQKHAEGINWFTVIEENATMPSQEARTKINEVMNRGGKNTLRSALIFEGTGFRAAATRSVVTGISFVSPLPFPHKIFGTVNTACAWLAGATKDTDPTALANAIEDARTSLLDHTSK